MPLGRWSLLRGAEEKASDASTEVAALVERLLLRYGVVFRDVIAREPRRFPWRVLLFELRRLEACGRVRGGRFVDGFVGEQFALPEAVDTLRRIRRTRDENGPVVISAADPLNLVGVIIPGERVSPLTQQVIAYHHGLAVQVGDLGSVRSRLQGDRP